MVKVALDSAQNLIVDDILIAQLDNRPSLHCKDFLTANARKRAQPSVSSEIVP